jgi:hypothetical protein
VISTDEDLNRNNKGRWLFLSIMFIKFDCEACAIKANKIGNLFGNQSSPLCLVPRTQ